MTESDDHTGFEPIARRIAPGSRVLRARPLKGGISAEMTAIELETPDGAVSRLIVRKPGEALLARNPDAARNEFELLRILRQAGLPVPTPLDLDLSGEIFSTPYLLLDYIEGSPEFAPSDPAETGRRLAEQLAAIHSIDFSQDDLSFLPSKADELLRNIDERATSPGGSLDDPRVLGTLRRLGPPPQRNPSALLHGDFWPGNILWRDRLPVAVIDWEDAGLGDPLIDLALARMELIWIFGPDAMNSFTRRYLSLVSLDSDNLPYWDLHAASRLSRLVGSDLTEWTIFFAEYGREDITPSTVREGYETFVAQALRNLKPLSNARR